MTDGVLKVSTVDAGEEREWMTHDLGIQGSGSAAGPDLMHQCCGQAAGATNAFGVV